MGLFYITSGSYNVKSRLFRVRWR